MKIFGLALKFLQALFKLGFYKTQKIEVNKIQPEYSLKYVEDIPDDDAIEEKTVYVVGENGYYWVVAFRCPCGCGDFIQLNLLPDGKHVWKLFFHHNTISIYPSVDREFSCKSHFNLTKGNVVWWTIDH